MIVSLRNSGNIFFDSRSVPDNKVKLLAGANMNIIFSITNRQFNSIEFMQVVLGTNYNDVKDKQ